MGISKQEALNAIDRDQAFFCAASDAVWDHPETAFQEFKSADIICKLLERERFTVDRPVAGIETAFTGRFGHGEPVIGILGEFDALSGMSQKAGISDKVAITAGEPGHGCGHHMISPGSVAAAVAIKEYLEKNQKEGTVIFLDVREKKVVPERVLWPEKVFLMNWILH